MKALGNALPEWGVLLGPEAAEGQAAEGSRGLVGAMGQLVSLAGSPEEGARRFHEMVETAVELFEEGSLPRAVTVFDVADRIVRKEKVAAPLVASVKEQAQRGLSPARLKAYAEKPEQHLPLRRVLDFFPALSPKGLLSALREERKREGRRLLLALLEVHGPAARQAALEEVEQLLERGTAGDEWHFLRNLLYVVRHGSDGPLDLSDFETDCVARLSETTLPPGLVKEAVATLALVRGEKAVAALLLRLAQLEEALLRADLAPEARTETESLVDRTVAALVRQGTPRALSAVVEHGLKTNPLLGNTRARLATLSTEDLSVDEESVQRLVRELRSVLPLRVLGLSLIHI